MRTVLILAAATALLAVPALAVDPYFVTTDLSHFYPIQTTYDGLNWGSTYEFWHQRQGCTEEPFPSINMPYRVPQFWDGTQLELGFGFAWQRSTNPACDPLTEADFTIEARLAKLDEIPPVGNPPYPTHLLVGEVLQPFSLAPNTRSNRALLFALDPIDQVIAPGEVVRLEFRIWVNEDTFYCQCVFPYIQNAYAKAPVVLPFIFENGFEEGHAAFWTAINGG